MSDGLLRIIPPITITDAMLVSSNVSEGPAADYNGASTYAAGDVVSHSGNRLLTQYASLQGGNIGHEPGASGSEAYWRAIGSAAAQYDSATTYAAGDGAQIDGDDVHQLWWSVLDDNEDNDPTVDAGGNWLLMSPTNRWAMFDQALGFGTGNARVATRWPEKIDVTLEPDADLDTICAFVLQGSSVQVTVTDVSGAGQIYDRTITVEGEAGRVKWQIDDAPHMHKVIFDDVVFTAGSQVRAQIFNTGGIAVCAELVLGLAIEAGYALAGARVGIQDYSIIEPDDFGTFQVTKRPWHQRASLDVLVTTDDLDPMVELLTLKRGSPMLFIGNADLRSTIIFGIVRNFDDTITWPDLTQMSLDLESV